MTVFTVFTLFAFLVFQEYIPAFLISLS